MGRDKIIGIRFNETELTQLNERAEKHHLKLSTYIRFHLFNAGFFVREMPIESITSGVPKRIASLQITEAVAKTNKMHDIFIELKEEFSKGLNLKKVTKNDLEQVKENRNLKPKVLWSEIEAKKKLNELKPPKEVKIE